MHSDVIIVGGGPAGVITALTAKSVNPERSVSLIKSIGDGVIPCAIPYMIETMADPAQAAMGNGPLDNADVKVIVDTVIAVDPDRHSVRLQAGGEMTYQKLVLATGTRSTLPPIPGIERPGVYTITKSLSATTALRKQLRSAREVAIIGGGFIGTEFADELSKIEGTKVHLVEILPNLLTAALDDEFCQEATEILQRAGVSIHTGQKVISINGQHGVESISLADGTIITADAVLVGIGARPEITLAQDAGLRITDGGSIWVDDYMRTTDQDVFAVGDCALKRDFFTRKEVPVMLASTATAEARIAGTNLYSIRVMRQIQGTIAAFSTRLGGTCFGSAGLTNRACLGEGIRTVSVTAVAPDRHPGVLPGARPLKVKLIFADRAGILLGGQISGGQSVGELINMVALGIQKRVTVRELDMMQIATHPLLTSAPTVHPLVNAAHMALAKLRMGEFDGSTGT
jgi:NADPH-dependent 2,4-dienoyl-CoA reductase/sulfur reductase-like enzyme